MISFNNLLSHHFSPAPTGLLKSEIKRKIFHFLSLLYLLGYIFLERGLILKILMTAMAFVTLIEFGRFFSPDLNLRIVKLFRGIHRAKEFYQPSGIFWTLLSSLLTMGLFYKKEIVVCSMGYLIFGDTASALIGTMYGRHRVLNKSLEGSIAFFCVSLLISFLLFNPLVAIASSIFATIIELLPLPYNDNFWIPILSAVFLTLIVP